MNQDSQPLEPTVAPNAVTAGTNGVWVRACFVTGVLGVPVAWLLSQLAFLPFYLGLFFFVLFGLLLGAIQFRLAVSVVPIRRRGLWVGGLCVAISVWLIALGFEYAHLDDVAVEHAIRTVPARSQAEADVLHRTTPGRVHEYLRRHHAPGGFVGYLRWAATSGRVPVAEVPDGGEAIYQLEQGPIGWSLRVVLTIILLSFGVLSQVLGLARALSPNPLASPVVSSETAGTRDETSGPMPD